MKKPQKVIIIDDNSNKELGILIKRYQSNWKILRRLKAIKMRGEGEKVKDIVNKLDVSGDVVTDWFQLYNDEGFDGLCKMKYEGRRVSEFEQHKDIIIDLIKNNVYNSYTELYVAIKDSVGEIKVGVDALRKFCKKNEIGVIKNVT